MSGYYVWNPKELGLGVNKMDQEHQELIAKMNALYDGCADKTISPDKIQSLLKDLGEFTAKHFADEESYMESIKFSGLSTHKLIHQQLLSQFNGYVEEFKKTKKLSDGLFSFLKVWLTSHIRGIDMKYADYVRQKKVS